MSRAKMVSFRVSDEDDKKLEWLAMELKCSRSSVMRRMLQQQPDTILRIVGSSEFDPRPNTAGTNHIVLFSKIGA